MVYTSEYPIFAVTADVVLLAAGGATDGSGDPAPRVLLGLASRLGPAVRWHP